MFEIDFIVLFKLLWKRKGIVLATILLFNLIGFCFWIMDEPKSVATTKLLIKDTGGSGFSSVLTGQTVGFGGGLSKSNILLHGEFIKSKPFARRLSTLLSDETKASFSLDNRRLTRFFPFLSGPKGEGTEEEESGADPIIKDILKTISFTSDLASDIISLKIAAKNQDAAVEIANTLASAYSDYSQERGKTNALKQIGFIQELLDKRKIEMEESEKVLAKYQSDNKTFDMEDEVTNLLLLIAGYKKDIVQNQLQIEVGEKRVGELNELIKETPRNERMEQWGRDPASSAVFSSFGSIIANSRFKLEALQREGAAKNHPGIKAEQDKIAVAENLIKAEMERELEKIGETDRENLVYIRYYEEKLKLEGEISIAIATKNAAEELVAESLEELGTLPPRTLEYLRIKREVQVNQEIHSMLLQQLEQAKIDVLKQPSLVEVIEPADSTKRVSDFPTVLTLFFSSGLGFFIGIAVALIAIALDSRFRGLDDLISKLDIKKSIVIENGKMKSEDLSHNLVDIASLDHKKILAISGFEPGNKGYGEKIAGALALLMAIRGKKTLLLNLAHFEDFASFEKNTLLEKQGDNMADKADLAQFAKDKTRGNKATLSKVLAGLAMLEDAIIKDQKGFDQIQAGWANKEDILFLASARMNELMEVLKKKYDQIIIVAPSADSPSISLSGLIFAEEIIFYCQLNNTQMALAQKFIKRLEAINKKPSWVIIES